MMRAVLMDGSGGPEVLRLGEAPRPDMLPLGVRIAVRATAVNRADTVQRRGKYPPPPGASPILGLECAGDVVEVGPAVQNLRPGARVMALLTGGGYAEEVVADAGAVLVLPESFSYAQGAAFMETTLTAFHNAFELGGVQRGQRLLVHGGGSGVGTQALALCREAQVTALVTAGSADKCARCRRLGAAAAIDYHKEDFAEAVLRHTDGQGVDCVLDCIGGAYLADNLRSLAPGGRLVVIGLMGGATASADLGLMLRRRLSVIGSSLRGQSAAAKRRLVAAFEAQFASAWRAGALTPVIDRVLALHEVSAAHDLMEASGHFGKIVLQVSE